jgi:hypothetical protein
LGKPWTCSSKIYIDTLDLFSIAYSTIKCVRKVQCCWLWRLFRHNYVERVCRSPHLKRKQMNEIVLTDHLLAITSSQQHFRNWNRMESSFKHPATGFLMASKKTCNGLRGYSISKRIIVVTTKTSRHLGGRRMQNITRRKCDGITSDLGWFFSLVCVLIGTAHERNNKKETKANGVKVSVFSLTTHSRISQWGEPILLSDNVWGHH